MSEEFIVKWEDRAKRRAFYKKKFVEFQQRYGRDPSRSTIERWVKECNAFLEVATK